MYKKKTIPALLWGWNYNSGKQSRARWPPTTSALLNLSSTCLAQTPAVRKRRCDTSRAAATNRVQAPQYGSVWIRVGRNSPTGLGPTVAFSHMGGVSLSVALLLHLGLHLGNHLLHSSQLWRETTRRHVKSYALFTLSSGHPKIWFTPWTWPETKACLAHVYE